MTSLILIIFSALLWTHSNEISGAIQRIKKIFGRGWLLVEYDINGDMLWLDRRQADTIGRVKQFVDTRINPEDNILIAPFEPGLYPILQRKAPIWDPFPIHNAPGKKQEQSISDLYSNHARWAILKNEPLDGMETRRFSNTHPLLWEYLITHYESIDLSGYSINRLILHRKNG